MKRFLSILLCFALLVCSSASADITVADSGTLFDNIPNGLQPLYELMAVEESSEDIGITTISRMTNGRVLVGMSITYVGQTFTIDQVVSRSAQAEQFLDGGIISTDGMIAVPEVMELFNVEVAHYQTSLLIEKDSFRISAEGFLVPMPGFVMELWIVSPDASLYAQDSTEAAELEADLQNARSYIEEDSQIPLYALGCIDLLTGKVNYKESSAAVEAAPIDSESYTTPDGHFTMNIPLHAIILSSNHSEAEWNAAQEAFIAQNPKGADRIFQGIREEIAQDCGTVIFTQDMKGYIQLYRIAGWDKFQLDDLAKITINKQRYFAEELGEAKLTALCELEEVAGLTHLREAYDLRSCECGLKMCILSSISDDGIFRELDIAAFTQDLQNSLYRMVVDSMAYHE